MFLPLKFKVRKSYVSAAPDYFNCIAILWLKHKGFRVKNSIQNCSSGNSHLFWNKKLTLLIILRNSGWSLEKARYKVQNSFPSSATPSLAGHCRKGQGCGGKLIIRGNWNAHPCLLIDDMSRWPPARCIVQKRKKKKKGERKMHKNPLHNRWWFLKEIFFLSS